MGISTLFKLGGQGTASSFNFLSTIPRKFYSTIVNLNKHFESKLGTLANEATGTQVSNVVEATAKSGRFTKLRNFVYGKSLTPKYYLNRAARLGVFSSISNAGFLAFDAYNAFNIDKGINKVNQGGQFRREYYSNYDAYGASFGVLAATTAIKGINLVTKAGSKLRNPFLSIGLILGSAVLGGKFGDAYGERRFQEDFKDKKPQDIYANQKDWLMAGALGTLFQLPSIINKSFIKQAQGGFKFSPLALGKNLLMHTGANVAFSVVGNTAFGYGALTNATILSYYDSYKGFGRPFMKTINSRRRFSRLPPGYYPEAEKPPVAPPVLKTGNVITPQTTTPSVPKASLDEFLNGTPPTKPIGSITPVEPVIARQSMGQSTGPNVTINSKLTPTQFIKQIISSGSDPALQFAASKPTGVTFTPQYNYDGYYSPSTGFKFGRNILQTITAKLKGGRVSGSALTSSLDTIFHESLHVGHLNQATAPDNLKAFHTQITKSLVGKGDAKYGLGLNESVPAAVRKTIILNSRSSAVAYAQQNLDHGLSYSQFKQVFDYEVQANTYAYKQVLKLSQSNPELGIDMSYYHQPNENKLIETQFKDIRQHLIFEGKQGGGLISGGLHSKTPLTAAAQSPHAYRPNNKPIAPPPIPPKPGQDLYNYDKNYKLNQKINKLPDNKFTQYFKGKIRNLLLNDIDKVYFEAPEISTVRLGKYVTGATSVMNLVQSGVSAYQYQRVTYETADQLTEQASLNAATEVTQQVSNIFTSNFKYKLIAGFASQALVSGKIFGLGNFNHVKDPYGVVSKYQKQQKEQIRLGHAIYDPFGLGNSVRLLQDADVLSSTFNIWGQTKKLAQPVYDLLKDNKTVAGLSKKISNSLFVNILAKLTIPIGNTVTAFGNKAMVLGEKVIRGFDRGVSFVGSQFGRAFRVAEKVPLLGKAFGVLNSNYIKYGLKKTSLDAIAPALDIYTGTTSAYSFINRTSGTQAQYEYDYAQTLTSLRSLEGSIIGRNTLGTAGDIIGALTFNFQAQTTVQQTVDYRSKAGDLYSNQSRAAALLEDVVHNTSSRVVVGTAIGKAAVGGVSNTYKAYQGYKLAQALNTYGGNAKLASQVLSANPGVIGKVGLAINTARSTKALTMIGNVIQAARPLVTWAAPLLKGAGVFAKFLDPAISLGMIGYGHHKVNNLTQTSSKEAYQSAYRTTYKGYGALAGAAVGGAIGSLFGPVGTYLGMTVGSIAGSYLGDKIGQSMANRASNNRATVNTKQASNYIGYGAGIGALTGFGVAMGGLTVAAATGAIATLAAPIVIPALLIGAGIGLLAGAVTGGFFGTKSDSTKTVKSSPVTQPSLTKTKLKSNYKNSWELDEKEFTKPKSTSSNQANNIIAKGTISNSNKFDLLNFLTGASPAMANDLEAQAIRTATAKEDITRKPNRLLSERTEEISLQGKVNKINNKSDWFSNIGGLIDKGLNWFTNKVSELNRFFKDNLKSVINKAKKVVGLDKSDIDYSTLREIPGYAHMPGLRKIAESSRIVPVSVSGSSESVGNLKRGGNDLTQEQVAKLTPLGKYLYQYRNNKYVLALSDVVAKAEGTDFRPGSKNFGYDMIIGNKNVGLSEINKGHPFVEGGRAYIQAGRVKSSASGRVQFMDFNYKSKPGDPSDLVRLLDAGDGTPGSFSPAVQDLGTLGGFYKRLGKAGFEKLIAGQDVESILTKGKLSQEYASLQTGGGARSSYGQGTPEGQVRSTIPFLRERIKARDKGLVANITETGGTMVSNTVNAIGTSTMNTVSNIGDAAVSNGNKVKNKVSKGLDFLRGMFSGENSNTPVTPIINKTPVTNNRKLRLSAGHVIDAVGTGEDMNMGSVSYNGRLYSPEGLVNLLTVEEAVKYAKSKDLDVEAVLPTYRESSKNESQNKQARGQYGDQLKALKATGVTVVELHRDDKTVGSTGFIYSSLNENERLFADEYGTHSSNKVNQDLALIRRGIPILEISKLTSKEGIGLAVANYIRTKDNKYLIEARSFAAQDGTKVINTFYGNKTNNISSTVSNTSNKSSYMGSMFPGVSLDKLANYNPKSFQGMAAMRGSRVHNKIDFDERVGGGDNAPVISMTTGLATWGKFTKEADSGFVKVKTKDDKGRDIEIVYGHLSLNSISKAFGGKNNVQIKQGQSIGNVRLERYAAAYGAHVDLSYKIGGQQVDVQQEMRRLLKSGNASNIPTNGSPTANNSITDKEALTYYNQIKSGQFDYDARSLLNKSNSLSILRVSKDKKITSLLSLTDPALPSVASNKTTVNINGETYIISAKGKDAQTILDTTARSIDMLTGNTAISMAHLANANGQVTINRQIASSDKIPASAFNLKSVNVNVLPFKQLIDNNSGGGGSNPTVTDNSTKPEFIKESTTSGTTKNFYISHGLNKVTSGMGMRTHPVTGKRKEHQGVDLGLNSGATFKNPFQLGQVVFAGNINPTGYGNQVLIAELDPNTKAPTGRAVMGAHLRNNSLSQTAGSIISGGTSVGVQGNTGIGTGEHLHVEQFTNFGANQVQKVLQSPGSLFSVMGETRTVPSVEMLKAIGTGSVLTGNSNTAASKSNLPNMTVGADGDVEVNFMTKPEYRPVKPTERKHSSLPVKTSTLDVAILYKEQNISHEQLQNIANEAVKLKEEVLAKAAKKAKETPIEIPAVTIAKTSKYQPNPLVDTSMGPAHKPTYAVDVELNSNTNKIEVGVTEPGVDILAQWHQIQGGSIPSEYSLMNGVIS